jgi:hypothetical protein
MRFPETCLASFGVQFETALESVLDGFKRKYLNE